MVGSVASALVALLGAVLVAGAAADSLYGGINLLTLAQVSVAVGLGGNFSHPPPFGHLEVHARAFFVAYVRFTAMDRLRAQPGLPRPASGACAALSVRASRRAPCSTRPTRPGPLQPGRPRTRRSTTPTPSCAGAGLGLGQCIALYLQLMRAGCLAAEPTAPP